MIAHFDPLIGRPHSSKANAEDVAETKQQQTDEARISTIQQGKGRRRTDEEDPLHDSTHEFWKPKAREALQ